MDDKTFDELVNLIEDQVSDYLRDNPSQRQSRPFCKICQKRGNHRTSDCSKSKTDASSTDQGLQPAFLNIKCYSCNNFGHKAHQCPNRQNSQSVHKDSFSTSQLPNTSNFRGNQRNTGGRGVFQIGRNRGGFRGRGGRRTRKGG